MKQLALLAGGFETKVEVDIVSANNAGRLPRHVVVAQPVKRLENLAPKACVLLDHLLPDGACSERVGDVSKACCASSKLSECPSEQAGCPMDNSIGAGAGAGASAGAGAAGGAEADSGASGVPVHKGPIGLSCYLCGREFSGASLPIHLRSCITKREAAQKLVQYPLHTQRLAPS